MPEYTTNYNLKKPLGNENYNIQDHNGNMDIIDQGLKQNADNIATKETPAGAQAKADTAKNEANAYTDQKTNDLAGIGRTTETVKGNADAVNSHTNSTSAHNATSAATASRIMMRDSAGRAKVAAPSAADDIARKDTVDAVQTSLTAHLAETAPHSATSAATANRLIVRDANGRAKVAAPSASDDIARLDSITKAQVGLSNVTNNAQMPIAGGTFTGVAVAQTNTSYTTRQIRNAILSTADPSGGSNGDIWFKYTP